MQIPDYLKQGDAARLFPVLAVTSKEGRTTSILLACLSRIDEFAQVMMTSVGQTIGVRGRIECWTEIVLAGDDAKGDRPDGLIVVRKGKSEYRILVEAKVGKADLAVDQVERYRKLAKETGIDAVLTISNQFATGPQLHPLPEVRKKAGPVPVFHWSWMYILTQADLLRGDDGVADADQAVLLDELLRFLSHESAGVRGFDRMPPDWTELNRLISAGGSVPTRSPEAVAVVDAWHQETRDLALILSRQTGTAVRERLPRAIASDPAARQKAQFADLRETQCLRASFDIPDAAGPMDVVVDLRGRVVEVGMTVRAPEDRVSSKARLNWLLRQISVETSNDYHVRCTWPGKSATTQHPLAILRASPDRVQEGKDSQQVTRFHVLASHRLGARFGQVGNFITDLERVVPAFYREIGQTLTPWRRPAPQVRPDRPTAEDVEVEALGEELRRSVG